MEGRHLNARKKWTPEEDKFLRENYATMSTKELCEHLKVAAETMRKRRVKLGIAPKRTNVKSVMTPVMDAFCVELRKKGMSLENIREECKAKYGKCCERGTLGRRLSEIDSGRKRREDTRCGAIPKDKIDRLLEYNRYLAQMRQELKPGDLVEATITEINEENYRPHNVEVWFEVIQAYPNYVAVKDGNFRTSFRYGDINSYRTGGKEKAWFRG